MTLTLTSEVIVSEVIVTFDLNLLKSKFGHFWAPGKDTKVTYCPIYEVRNFIGDMTSKVKGHVRI